MFTDWLIRIPENMPEKALNNFSVVFRDLTIVYLPKQLFAVLLLSKLLLKIHLLSKFFSPDDKSNGLIMPNIGKKVAAILLKNSAAEICKYYY